MSHSKIVAFLQNPWFPEGTAERHVIMYRDDQKFHQRLLLGTMTGGRLRTAFGELFDEIWWDNTSWKASIGRASGKMPPDFGHMFRIIEQHQPKIVLAFGNQAREACKVTISKFCNPPVLLACHHPNARYRTQAELDEFANSVRHKLLELELIGKGTVRGIEDALTMEGRYDCTQS